MMLTDVSDIFKAPRAANQASKDGRGEAITFKSSPTPSATTNYGRKARIVIGVDPGLNGALAVLVFGVLNSVQELPTITHSPKEALFGPKNKTKRSIDYRALHQSLALLPLSNTIPDLIVMEHVSASPQMGVTSAFSFGEGYGLVLGVLAAVFPHTPIHFVRPSVWKMRLNVTKDKKQSNELAAELFPAQALLFKSKDAGLAEAALLAYYGETYITTANKK